MTWTGTDIVGLIRTFRTRPGTGREALVQATLFWGASRAKSRTIFLFGRAARASRPVPGLVPLKYFPPMEAATAADLT